MNSKPERPGFLTGSISGCPILWHHGLPIVLHHRRPSAGGARPSPPRATGRRLRAFLGTLVRCRKASRPFAPGAFPDFRTIPSPPVGSLRSPSLLTENARGLSTVRSLPLAHTFLSKSFIHSPSHPEPDRAWRIGGG